MLFYLVEVEDASVSAFSKRIEYWIIGRMLKDGLDVYVPLVDDHAVDALVKRKDGSIAQVQIKARSVSVADSDAALFAAIWHEHRQDYWFCILLRTPRYNVADEIGRVHRGGCPEQDREEHWSALDLAQRGGAKDWSTQKKDL